MWIAVGRRLKRAIRAIDAADLPVLAWLPASWKRQMVRRLDWTLGRVSGADHEIDGFQFRLPRGLIAAYTIDGHEPRTTMAVRSILEPGMTAIDVGANVGWFTLQMARAVGPSGTVIALEPNPENLGFLRHNVASNHLGDVEVVAAAAAASEGESQFRVDLGGTRNRLERGGRTDRSIVVRTCRLDQLVRGPVHLIKLDTEGTELDVLRGTERLVVGPEKPKLVFEWNLEAMLDAGFAPQELLDWLVGHGYRLQEIDSGGTLHEIAAGRLDGLRQMGKGHLELVALPTQSKEQA